MKVRRIFPPCVVLQVIVVCICFLEGPAYGRVVKFVLPEGEKSGELSFYWQPQLPNIEWWEYDNSASLAQKAVVFVPLGADFFSAEAVILARAVERREACCPTLGEFASFQKERVITAGKNDIELVEKRTSTLGNNNVLRSYLFSSHKTGAVELRFYGEERNFYLVFSLKARTKKAYSRALPTYRRLLRRYFE